MVIESYMILNRLIHVLAGYELSEIGQWRPAEIQSRYSGFYDADTHHLMPPLQVILNFQLSAGNTRSCFGENQLRNAVVAVHSRNDIKLPGYTIWTFDSRETPLHLTVPYVRPQQALRHS